jgi:photosystem II stability/assembly factor-like uncharacterized protein
MKKILLPVIISLFIVSCKKETTRSFEASFARIASVDTLLKDSISIRTLAADGDKLWYAGSGGKYGWVSLSGGKNFNGIAAHDTIFPEFRALAQTKSHIFIVNVASPAFLYKISKDGRQIKQVYTEAGEKVFYDCMKFYNDKEGIAMGDPQNGCLSILTTKDGGDTWQKHDCTNLPAVVDGEAAFAASNTNIIIKEGKTWVISGGKKSRVFYSEDKGETWSVTETPIIQGGEMTGMFTADFYDAETGFAAGGDYEKPEQNTANKILTADGGKTWKRVGEGVGPGYVSCVQFVPGSKGGGLFTVGRNGVFYSANQGTTWKKLHDAANLNTLIFIDKNTVVAAGQRVVVRFRLQ